MSLLSMVEETKNTGCHLFISKALMNYFEHTCKRERIKINLILSVLVLIIICFFMFIIGTSIDRSNKLFATGKTHSERNSALMLTTRDVFTT